MLTLTISAIFIIPSQPGRLDQYYEPIPYALKFCCFGYNLISYSHIPSVEHSIPPLYTCIAILELLSKPSKQIFLP